MKHKRFLRFLIAIALPTFLFSWSINATQKSLFKKASIFIKLDVVSGLKKLLREHPELATIKEENYLNTKTTLLLEACKRDKSNVNLINLLLKYKAPCNTPDNQGRTPLHYLCRNYDNKDSIRRLLKAGGNIFIPSQGGASALVMLVTLVAQHPLTTLLSILFPLKKDLFFQKSVQFLSTELETMAQKTQNKLSFSLVNYILNQKSFLKKSSTKKSLTLKFMKALQPPTTWVWNYQAPILAPLSSQEQETYSTYCTGTFEQWYFGLFKLPKETKDYGYFLKN